MHLSLRLSALALLAVLFTATPASVHAQTPTSTPSDSTDDFALWPIVIIIWSIAGLLLLGLCCAACWESGTRRPRVRDVEQPLATTSRPTQGQGENAAAPVPPPQAHTKENAGAVNEPELNPGEVELAPPPYYPPVPPRPVPACTAEGSHDAELNSNDPDDGLGAKW